MFIKSVLLVNIRNHTHTFFSPAKGFNIFVGKNGAGKTSILEAISLGSLTKSFVTNYDQNIVAFGQNYYLVEIEAESEKASPLYVKITYQKGKKKQIFNLDGSLIDARDHIGRIPAVILNPSMKNLIFGSPNTRREFIDKTISQVSPSYLNDLIKFRRILKQRNKFLSNYAFNKTGDLDLLQVWTEQFIKYATKLISRRVVFFDNFLPFFIQSLNEITQGREEGGLLYKPFAFPKYLTEEDQIRKIFWEQFSNIKNVELRKGVSLFGPHKDDFQILINNKPAREIASQGQSKSILIAIKYAEMKFFFNYSGTTPIILLDDIFSELDSERIKQVVNLISKEKLQSFLTLTELSFLMDFVDKGIPLKIYSVENGKCSDFPINKLKEFQNGN